MQYGETILQFPTLPSPALGTVGIIKLMRSSKVSPALRLQAQGIDQPLQQISKDELSFDAGVYFLAVEV